MVFVVVFLIEMHLCMCLLPLYPLRLVKIISVLIKNLIICFFGFIYCLIAEVSSGYFPHNGCKIKKEPKEKLLFFILLYIKG